MTTSKRVLLAAIASAASVAGISVLLWNFPIPAAGRVFIAVGYPLAYLIVQVTPESALRALAPQGGPEAVAWAFAIASPLTWFVLVFVPWYMLIGRMRSNPPVNADARDVPAPASDRAARAGYRAR